MRTALLFLVVVLSLVAGCSGEHVLDPDAGAASGDSAIAAADVGACPMLAAINTSAAAPCPLDNLNFVCPTTPQPASCVERARAALDCGAVYQVLRDCCATTDVDCP